MRKRKAYFGECRRHNKRHYPKLLRRAWQKYATDIAQQYKEGSWVKAMYDRALQVRHGFSETWYKTVVVPFTEKKRWAETSTSATAG